MNVLVRRPEPRPAMPGLHTLEMGTHDPRILVSHRCEDSLLRGFTDRERGGRLSAEISAMIGYSGNA